MVTMQEISKRAGVTTATVSNILNGKLKFDRPDAAKRAARVRKIAAEMGYRLNRAARATRTGRTGCIGMLFSHNLSHSVRFEDFEQGLGEAAEAHNLLLVTGLISEQALKDPTFVPRLVGESLVDGLLINYVIQIPPEINRLITEHNRPAIWINSKHSADCVYPDDEGAAYAATKYLIERGHRKIAYGCTWKNPNVQSGHYAFVDRPLGYRRAMKEAGLPVRVWEPNEPIDASNFAGHGLRHAHQLLSNLGDSTALVHGSRSEPLILAAAQRGIQIPKDLSLVTFINGRADSPEIQCTRVIVPFYDLGREAIRLLTQKLENGNESLPPVTLQFGVTEGDTVRPL